MTRFLRTLATALAFNIALPLLAQEPAITDTMPPAATRVAELDLSTETSRQLSALLAAKNFRGAEALLLAELATPANPLKKNRLLSFLGGVYFSAGDYLQAAIAWKKADALAPLQPPLRFPLAMAYVRLGHGDWARAELNRLAAEQPANAMYPYWLGRVDYDAQHYDAAIGQFQKALQLDGAMARAHDNLGLCYFYLNQNKAAEVEFRKAIALAKPETLAAAWPHLNLGIVLEFLGQLDPAVTEVQQAITLDPALPQARLEMGKLLEKQDRLAEAVASFRQAVQLDPRDPQPHSALARLLRRQGDNAGSQREVAIYKELQQQQFREGQHQTTLPERGNGED